jgi:hypothetical protein
VKRLEGNGKFILTPKQSAAVMSAPVPKPEPLAAAVVSIGDIDATDGAVDLAVEDKLSHLAPNIFIKVSA